MKRKCEYCGTFYKFTKKDIKKELRFKKNQIETYKTKAKYLYSVDYVERITKFKCISNVWCRYIECPVCDYKRYLDSNSNPTPLFYDKDVWKIISKSKKDTYKEKSFFKKLFW